MGRWSEPPFARGETYFNGDKIDTTDLTNLGGEILEGRHYVFEDSIHLSGSEVHVKVVRNMSATAVMPGQLLLPTVTGSYVSVSPEPAGVPPETAGWAPGDFIGRVNGTTSAVAQFCYIADEILPGNGVPQYDLFYVVTQGPVAVNLLWPNVAIAVGNRLVSAVTTSATQGPGMASLQSLALATTTSAADAGAQIQNAIGIAMETVPVAATTSATQYTAGYLTTIPCLINAGNKW